MSATATTSLEVLATALGGPDLVRDYRAREPRLAPFYTGHPTDPDAWRRKAAAVAGRLTPELRRRIAPALRPLSDTATDKLERILAGEGFVVTTGQQAGLFGGPLYTINKALTAMRLAEALEAQLDRPVLAVFWVAADDHDWAEVDHTWVLDRGGDAVRIAVDADPDAPPVAMADRALGDGIRAALEALEAALPETEFATPLLEAVRAAYRPDASVADAFEALLAHLFDGHDLALLNSAHPAVRRAASPVLARAVERSDEHARIVANTTARLERAGYHAQVAVADDASNVFLHDEHGRDRLVREDGAWMLRRTKRRLSDAELAELMKREPGGFSPNVFLRPVVESAILPTLGYVGGPAEVSYFAQIGCLFEAHGVEPPLVVPRFRITLVEGRVRRIMEKFGLDLTAFERPLHELTAELVRHDLPDSVTASAERLRAGLIAGYDAITEGAVAIDPTLEGWLGKQRNAALNGVDDAVRKVASHLRKRKQIEIGQIERAASGIAPEGAPQERKLSILPFVARYGLELVRDMKASLSVEWGPPATEWTGVRCGS